AGTLPGLVEPGLQVLLGDRRDRRAARTDAEVAWRCHRRERGQDPVPLPQLLLLRARALRRLRSRDRAYRTLTFRQGASGNPRQRDSRAVRRHPDPALSLHGLPRFRRLHRHRRSALGAAQRAHHAGHPLLAILGRDRLHVGAGRVPQLHRPHRRRRGLQLPEGFRRWLHGLLAVGDGSRPGRPGAGASHRDRGHGEAAGGDGQEAVRAMSYLVTEKLTKYFGDTHAVDKVDFFTRADDYGGVRGEASAILRQCGLDRKAKQLAGGSSQGERKLLDVAVAYALKPQLLFLDEPTSGVSTREKAPIMDVISSIVRSQRITAVVIEHDMDIIFKYSDRIVVMHQGLILASGSPEEIRSNESVKDAVFGPTHA